MRIPSQFNEDNLYRRRNRRVDSVQSYRRLVRMLVALFLVVVVMRQASRPAIYEVFFGDAATGGSQVAGNGTFAAGVSIEEPAEIELDDATRLIANELTGTLAPSDQLQWLATLSRWQASRPPIRQGIFAPEATAATFAATMNRLDAMDGVGEERKGTWQEMLESLQAHICREDGPGPSESANRSEVTGRPQVLAWIKTLDEAATNRVVDASVWQSTDFGAFYRFLDQGERLSDAGVVSIGVLPLLKQPEVYRNSRVRFAGTVARAERVDATDNPFGVNQYWRLWLRPRDGADRPLLAIVPAVPSLVASVGAEASELEGPAVTMVGRFLKRLPYRSSIGPELAPVVIGRLITVPVTETELVVAPTADDTPSITGRLWLTVAAASAIGLLLAAITIRRTSAMEKRARQLRVSNRKEPNEFLDGLRSATPRTESETIPEDTP